MKLSDLVNYDVGSHFGLRDICIFNRSSSKLTRLTTERGMSAPAWSPNGLLLAWFEGSNTITVWDVSTNRSEQFQSASPIHLFEGHLDWSQDSRKIFIQGAGIVLDLEQKVFIDQLPVERNLYQCCFTWSPDQIHLAYHRVMHEYPGGYHSQIVIAHNNQISFTTDFEINIDDHLEWSPDSSFLAWVAMLNSETEATRYQLALTDVKTGKTRFLTFGKGFIGISGLSWSPSRNQLAVRQGDELHIVNVTAVVSSAPDVTIQKENITLKGSSFRGISWSPDEKYIAYDTDWQEGSRIWILEPDSNSHTPLVWRLGN